MPKAPRSHRTKKAPQALKEAFNKECRLRSALEGLRTGQYTSLHGVVRAIKVAAETLRQRREGRLSKAEDKALWQLLTTEEEKLLVKWITELTDCHIPARPAMLIGMAMMVLWSRDLPSTRQPGRSWPTHFIARYDDVRVCFGRQLD
jgi:hypothetical protein